MQTAQNQNRKRQKKRSAGDVPLSFFAIILSAADSSFGGGSVRVLGQKIIS